MQDSSHYLDVASSTDTYKTDFLPLKVYTQPATTTRGQLAFAARERRRASGEVRCWTRVPQTQWTSLAATIHNETQRNATFPLTMQDTNSATQEGSVRERENERESVVCVSNIDGDDAEKYP